MWRPLGPLGPVHGTVHEIETRYGTKVYFRTRDIGLCSCICLAAWPIGPDVQQLPAAWSEEVAAELELSCTILSRRVT